MTVEITGIHGGGVYPDGTLYSYNANRVKKGVELLASKETDYIVMLGNPGPYMKRYALQKYPHISKNRILVEGRGKSSIEETKNFKKHFIDPNNFTNIGKISQKWHLPRIAMVDSKLLPFPKYRVEYFKAEDNRSEKEIRFSEQKEKSITEIYKWRLKIPLSTSIFAEELSELGKKLYLHMLTRKMGVTEIL